MCSWFITFIYYSFKKIYHRDLKPHNILLTYDYTIKICDFGFATNNELSTMNCRTQLYMAPELILNKTFNIKSDLWSLGIILYELIFKKNPFNNCFNLKDLEFAIKKFKKFIIRFIGN